MQTVPRSVLGSYSCSLCWRRLEGTYYSQTLENVTRYLCTGCQSLLFPSVPEGMEGRNLVRIDAKELFKE